MLLTLIICTRNRAGEIINCLPEVAHQAKEYPDVEVIVVDNGSTDNTKQVVEDCSEKYAYSFRYIYESVPGLCQARNRGRIESRGTVLAYIDDDVQIQQDWIKKIRQHFLQEKSDCLGGKVSVKLEVAPPFEIGDDMLWFFQATKFGEVERCLLFPEHPIGCNMAFRRDVFDAVGGFNTELKLYGDETDLFRRINEKQFTVFYNPEVEVSQIIPGERLTVAELRHKSYIWGKGSATLWLLSHHGECQRVTKIAEFLLRTIYIRARSVSGANFGKFYTLWYNRGYLAQLLKGLEKT